MTAVLSPRPAEELAHLAALLASRPPVSPERLDRALALLEKTEIYEEFRDRVHVSRHEAGHAVMALALGLGVQHASIRPRHEDRVAGFVLIAAQATADRRARSLAERDRLERTILAYLAGGAVDRLSRTPAADDSSQTDRETVVDLLRAWPEPLDDVERDHLLAWFEAHAQRRLIRAWPAVVHIACELLLYDEADAARLAALYTEALGVPPAPLLRDADDLVGSPAFSPVTGRAACSPT